MDEFDDDVFRKTTHQTDCLETDALNLKNQRQLKLGKDLGIYIVERDGSVSGRVDAVSRGEPHSLAMYDTRFNVKAVPWAKFEEKRHPHTGAVSRELSMDGTIRAGDIVTTGDLTIDERLGKVGNELSEARASLSQKIDAMTASLQTLLTSVSTLSSELSDVKDRLQQINDNPSKARALAMESSHPDEVAKWRFRADREDDGRPSLAVTYEGETASKFMGTPNSIKRHDAQALALTPSTARKSSIRTPSTVQAQSSTLTPSKQRMSVTLRTPSDKKANRAPGSASKEGRAVNQVETVNLSHVLSPLDL